MSDKNYDVVSIINTIFHTALKRKASDIHIEPTETQLNIRVRIDGEFGEFLTYEKAVHQPIVTRIKMLADLKIDETRLPQDGKAAMKTDSGDTDLRISVLPTIYGEKVVIRILSNDNANVDLETLGILDYAMKKIEEALKKSYGIILVTGPTGAGKTTSLYGMLSRFDPKEYNISTLEDPVEYKMPGVNQTQVHRDIGFDFSQGLRSLVRQDPDIIMVGEIRDKETASLAIESALTGHLVFSTIHTNNASSTIQRLVNMGVETYLLPSALRIIIAQRLVRRICPHCSEHFKPHENVIAELKQEVGNVLELNEQELVLKRGKGCVECGNSGYLGRIGVYEVLPVTPAVADAILRGDSVQKIETLAKEEGMLTMKQDGCIKTIMGLTSLEEVMSTIG